jgi:nicotinate-nucleotide adenylyltransferase
MRRIGLFGGSFNPVHVAHLILAEQAREKAELEQVRFIPARQPPHKPDMPLAADEDRVQMLRLATAGNPDFSVETLELEREGPSYTLRTVQELKRRLPAEVELCLMLGGDSVEDLPNWWRAGELVEAVSVVPMHRPGHTLGETGELERAFGAEKADHILESAIDTPLLQISATNIRRRIERGDSIRYLVPEPVRQYILRHDVYPLD